MFQDSAYTNLLFRDKLEESSFALLNLILL
jgi:hypothetical protein